MHPAARRELGLPAGTALCVPALPAGHLRGEPQSKGEALAAEAVEAQGKGGVSAVKAVEHTRQKALA